ncbi:MAG: protoporphyrinogen oxidase [Chloroflexi bacterium]|jgi:oxygen-dependent protoporphyrinogen oxidase|nr:protoporphyrinogen oxidase [Chloroflexota bacterium]
MQSSTQVAIIGGGISGLATAYYLEQDAAEQQVPLAVTVIEKAPVLGGKIATDRRDGFIIEGGPESFVTRKPWAWELCQELGLGDRMVGTKNGKNYILHDGRPQIVPMSPVAFIRSPLLSTGGKLRLFKEPFVEARRDPSDETLGSFIRRRLGDEALENLVGPAVGSIYLSDADQMSVQVSFDRFAELEREHGSLVKGMFSMMRSRRGSSKSNSKQEKPPAFATLRTGLMELVETLADRIQGDILTGTGVSELEHNPGAAPPYALHLDDGQTLHADTVVLALPAYNMAELLAPYDEEIAGQLRSVVYNSVTTVTLSFNEAEIEAPFDGFGVVMPAKESSQLLAVEGMSVKFPHRAPEGQFVLRAFVGGHNQSLARLPDEELLALVRRELESIFGITVTPTIHRIFRWPQANPQCGVGHLRMMDEIEGQLSEMLPNLYLTGSALRGLGVPDCVRQAHDTADQVLAQIKQTAAVPV